MYDLKLSNHKCLTCDRSNGLSQSTSGFKRKLILIVKPKRQYKPRNIGDTPNMLNKEMFFLICLLNTTGSTKFNIFVTQVSETFLYTNINFFFVYFLTY